MFDDGSVILQNGRADPSWHRSVTRNVPSLSVFASLFVLHFPENYGVAWRVSHGHYCQGPTALTLSHTALIPGRVKGKLECPSLFTTVDDIHCAVVLSFSQVCDLSMFCH